MHTRICIYIIYIYIYIKFLINPTGLPQQRRLRASAPWRSAGILIQINKHITTNNDIDDINISNGNNTIDTYIDYQSAY